MFEIVVNGAVVERRSGVSAGKSVELEGTIELPEAGWVAARAYSSERPKDAWPSMHVRPFVHASPVWIEEVGSSDPQARAEAAADLLRALAASEARANEAYGEVPMPRLKARFEAARQKLEAMLPEDAQ